jgi:hypothetical protein
VNSRQFTTTVARASRDLAEDVAAALDAHPRARAFFDSLAQFYRRAYERVGAAVDWHHSPEYEPMLRLLRDVMGLRVEFSEERTTELSLANDDRVQVFAPGDS